MNKIIDINNFFIFSIFCYFIIINIIKLKLNKLNKIKKYLSILIVSSMFTYTNFVISKYIKLKHLITNIDYIVYEYEKDFHNLNKYNFKINYYDFDNYIQRDIYNLFFPININLYLKKEGDNLILYVKNNRENNIYELTLINIILNKNIKLINEKRVNNGYEKNQP
jgi:hypothetical protein